MQLNIKLSFLTSQSWKFDQSILQWIFYKILYDVHNEKAVHWLNYWLFTFSNIFFEKSDEFEAWKVYNITFKSIDQNIINNIYEWLLLKKSFSFWKNNKIFIHKVHVNNENPIYSWKTIKFESPVVLWLDEELCNKYWVKYDSTRKPLYWKKDLWLNIFVKQLTKNILKKYVFLINQWYIKRLNNFDNELLEKYKDIAWFEEWSEWQDFFRWYKYHRCALVWYKWWTIVWSVWSFVVWDNKNSVKVLKNVSLTGFGEKTTAGFGFIK